MPRTLAGTALISVGSLLLEIALTRVLSVLYVQSYVFLLLSVAVLGIGLGAVLATLWPSLRRAGTVAWGSSLAGLSALLHGVLLGVTMGAPRLLVFTATLIPFLFVGLALATLFSLAAAASPRLYWADLSGAGLGVVLAVPLLNALGGLDATFLAAGVLATAALFFARAALVPIGLAGLVLLGTVGQLSLSLVTLEPSRLQSPKPILEQLRAGGRITQTRWDAFSRTDLVQRGNARYLYMDGGAGSLVPEAAQPQRWAGDIGSFPFVADAPGSAFMIGPGGGLDIALARRFGTGDLTAVEVNGSSIGLVHDLSSYAGDLYGADVTVYTDEGRSVLRRSGRAYDLIFLSQVVTGAAEARGYALAENTLYTVQAFRDYLEHLTPNGQIVLKLYDELTLTRALLTAVATLAETGLSEADAAAHVLAFLDARANPPIPLLVVKKTAPDREEAVRLARVAETRGYALLFVPGLLARSPLDGLLAGTRRVADIARSSADLDLRPVVDERPFFYHFSWGLPGGLRGLVLALGLVLGLGGLAYLARLPKLEPGLRAAPLLFAALGFGFMALEVALLQRSGLYLGHPTLGLSTVLGTLLLGGGLGSALGGGRFSHHPARGVTVGAALAVIFALLWGTLWPTLAAATAATPAGLRVGVVALSLAPLALVLGMPFPLALTAVGRYGPGGVALAWGINGIMSVAGAVAATALALRWGFPSVWAAAAVAYGLAAVSGFGLKRRAAAPQKSDANPLTRGVD